MKKPAALQILAQSYGFLIADVHLARFHDVRVGIPEEFRIQDLHVVRIRIHAFAGHTMNGAHQLAVRAWRVREPSMSLRWEKVPAAEFRTTVWAGVRQCR